MRWFRMRLRRTTSNRTGPGGRPVPAAFRRCISPRSPWPEAGKAGGSDLAIDALDRALSVAGYIGPRLVILDVIDDGGDEVFARRMAFYRRLGPELSGSAGTHVHLHGYDPGHVP